MHRDDKMRDKADGASIAAAMLLHANRHWFSPSAIAARANDYSDAIFHSALTDRT